MSAFRPGFGSRYNLRGRLSGRPGRMAVIVSSMMVLYALWLLTGRPGGHRELVSDLSFVPISLAAILGAWGASRRCAGRRYRSAWRLVALAAASYMAGDLIWMTYVLTGHRPFPSAADGFYLLFYPLMLCALLRFPGTKHSLREYLRLALDLAIMALGGAVVVVYLVLGPTVLAGGPDALSNAVSLAYPVGDMVLLVGLASVLLRGAGANIRSLQLIAVGLVFFIAADLAFGYISLHSTYLAGNPVDGLWMMAMACFAVAGAAQPRLKPGATDSVNRRLTSASWAPYVAVLAAFAILIISQDGEPLLPDLILVIAICVVAILVSMRQVLAQRDLLQTRNQLAHQSLHDALTGLPNRVLVLDRAAQMLARARRTGKPVAALYVDVDTFKHINDSFGHAAGDEVLRVVAARLAATVRESDTVGRLAGDEFVVLLDNFDFDATPEMVADRLLEVLTLPIELPPPTSRAVRVSASIGIAVGRYEGADELLRDADFALYQAKEKGKNRWLVFEPGSETATQDRVALAMDLGEALEHDQLYLVYQPIVDLETESPIAVEALIRWRHPSRGTVLPLDFIPLAEETGLILPVGRWVLRNACDQAVAWRTQGMVLGVSVNVSPRQLDDAGFVEDVAAILAETGIDPDTVTLEITESTLMREPDMATKRLAELKDLGLHIAIDDLGTGYSSLAYLSRFPVDSLKIDRSFVAGLTSSEEARALVRMLVKLGKSLRLDVVGEGIEDTQQLHQLQEEHCDYGQGFLFARPVEADEIPGLVSPAGVAAMGAALSAA